MTNRKIERTGDHHLVGIARRPGPNETWQCRVCHYTPNVGGKSLCTSCGRDWYGNPGRIPADQPHRPGLRGD